METKSIQEKDILWLKMCKSGASIMQKCSKAQYFSYVVDENGRVRGCGYNGTPPGMKNCTEGGCPRAINNVPPGTPYNFGPGLCLSNHAEMNAIIGIDRSILIRSTLYVNGVCCFGCAKEIVGAGIRRVVGISSSSPKREDHSYTEMIFTNSGVEWTLYPEELLLSATP